VRAKILLQELWSQEIGWDDPIEHDVYRQAKSWLDELKDLESIRILRCLPMNNDQFKTIHTFVDALISTYGAVSYLRTEHPNERVEVKIVASKIE
jgi:hypothetical protein